MTALPPDATRVHLDNDTDDVLAAREEIDAIAWKLNQLIAYCFNLFGFSGEKADAIYNLFSGAAVLFPAGTRMFFMQATVPAGWVKFTFDTGRYLMAVPGDTGGQPIGNNNVSLGTSLTALTQAHLPAITIGGTTGWVGSHSHVVMGVEDATYNISTGAGQAAFGMTRQQLRQVSDSGAHYHDVILALGGQNAGHGHVVDMSNYRPAGWQGVIGTKA